jgi:hypothetical protein
MFIQLELICIPTMKPSLTAISTRWDLHLSDNLVNNLVNSGEIFPARKNFYPASTVFRSPGGSQCSEAGSSWGSDVKPVEFTATFARKSPSHVGFYIPPWDHGLFFLGFEEHLQLHESDLTISHSSARISWPLKIRISFEGYELFLWLKMAD